MDLERDRLRTRLRLCQAGFLLSSIGLGMLCFELACFWGAGLTRQREVWQIVHSAWWNWIFGATIPWATLIGSYFFWGRSTDPSWQRRAGMLVLMNGIDVCSWFLEYGHALGLGLGPPRLNWLQWQLTSALGWLEFILFASLAADILRELGNPGAAEREATARWLSTVGLLLWLLLFIGCTNWKGGWPLRGFQPLLGMLATGFLQIVTAFQVTVLSLAAGRQCARVRSKMDHEDEEHELLRSPSERAGEDPFAWLEHQHQEDPWR